MTFNKLHSQTFDLLLIRRALAAVFGLLLLTHDGYAEQPEEQISKRKSPLGTVVTHDPTKAYQGFTLYPMFGEQAVYLLDMQGDIVKKWNLETRRVRLLKNCNLLNIHKDRLHQPFVREYNFDLDLVWDYKAPGPVHHDISRLPNGNTIFLYFTYLRQAALQKFTDIPMKRGWFRSDGIQEVTPNGEVSWEWKAVDHLDLQSCGQHECKKVKSTTLPEVPKYDWTHFNTVSVIPENPWYKKGHMEFAPGNLVVVARHWSTVMIIDKNTKEIVWQYEGDKLALSFPHEAHIISPGLPGAGNMIIFDNGVSRKQSRILEISPVNKKTVWTYENADSFYSVVAGSMQRLPNGNTFISEDANGRMFEVTTQKEIVWKYLPSKKNARITRAHRYSYTHCPRLSELYEHSGS